MIYHTPIPASAERALEEVNEFRAKKGLTPFLEDLCLTEACMRLADFRAANHIEGHTQNDFAYLSPNCKADAMGCSAMEDSWGWHSCCDSENWKYGGAARTLGDDNRWYMHLAVRGKGK